MRPIWKGSITFGLVNIPIALYSATHREDLQFRLLRGSDLSPINYKRIAEVDGKEVPWDKIVKGYEYEKGKFVVLKEEDFKRVDLEATQTIEITDFVDLAEVDPIFFSKPYYIEPDKKGPKPYSLLRDALVETGKVGIAKVVIKTREHLAAVKPNGKLLVLELMHFADELSDSSELKQPDADLGKKEMTMAKSLIESMTTKWEPEKYQDTYRETLKTVIEEKIEKGDKRSTPAKRKTRRPTNVIDLVSVLQESLEKAGGSTKPPATRSRRKKPAPKKGKPKAA